MSKNLLNTCFKKYIFFRHQGVLLLNACLTVRAHQANSHAKRGWVSGD